MKNCKKLKFLAGTAALTLAVGLSTIDANATNGYFAHGYSVKSKAMAGAGVAMPEDTLSFTTNPAGMVGVGKRYDVGMSIFNPNREYKTNTSNPAGGWQVNAGQESGTDYFLVPYAGANWELTADSTIGLAVFGNGGMNTSYENSVFGGGFGQANDMPTGVDLMQLFVATTYAKRINDQHSFGITPILGYQKFEAQGLAAFAGMSNAPNSLTNNGHDTAYGYGARVGYMGQLTPDFSVGLAYQSRIYMDNFDDYKGLFAEQGDMDIPSNWTVGFAAKATPTLTIAFDVQRINYNELNSVGNLFAASNTLGPDNGKGFGWDDMTIYKLGVKWQQSDEMTWRAGYSYGSQPIPTTEMLFNIIAPGVIEQHATLGFTKQMANNQELDFSVMRAFSNSVSGISAYSPTQTVELAMDQWEVSVGYSWKF